MLFIEVKMKHKIEKKEMKSKGFSFIEVLFSLLLVSLVLISLVRLITFSLDEYRKSAKRYNMMQKMENCTNRLMAKDFDSTDLGEGDYQKNEEKIELTWKIESLSPTLKKIRLAVSYKIYKKKIYFYKSKFIDN
jgi:Tfp pilus assembly protein PilV